MSYLGSIENVENIGLSPYQIAGNPALALIAQLNRFAKRTITLPPITDSCRTKGTRNYLRMVADSNQPLPMVPVIDPTVANLAHLIMYDRLTCVAPGLGDPRKLKQVVDAEGDGKIIIWAMSNTKDITTQIAQFADKLGLDPAKVGITAVDPKMKSKFPTMTVVLIGALAVAAVVVARRKS
jgi:hypothetical protein